MSEALTQDRVRDVLNQVMDPEINHSVVELGIVQNIEVEAGNAVFVEIRPTTPNCPFGPQLKQRVYDAVAAIEGVGPVEVEWAH